MTLQRGLALITGLLLTVLAFLAIVGGALLSSRTNAQHLFVTEAGIEAARETLPSAVEAKVNPSSSDNDRHLARGNHRGIEGR